MKKRWLKTLLSDYGSVLILILLCAYYCVVTWSEQHPDTPRAGRQIAQTVVAEFGPDAGVIVVVRDTNHDRAFAEAVQTELTSGGANVIEVIHAGRPYPARARQAIEKAASSSTAVDAMITHHAGARWGPLQPSKLTELATRFPALEKAQVRWPQSYMWPSFFTRENLLNVLKNNAEIAIIAIGMTMVIITAGIDLSVGSLLALCAVITAVTIQGWAGGKEASGLGVVGCCVIGAGIGAMCGAFSGVMVTLFRVPAFIVTLALLMIARGLALIVSVRYQQTISGGATAGTPEAVRIQYEGFGWLSNGATLGIPNPILLMVLLYVLAHIVMTHTPFGRYIYAVGGNREAARLSGVPVVAVLILVYAICGAMAGLGGIVDASRFLGGRPTAGELYELQVIAAVVVGGTSLAGGEGRIFGTFVGAIIIAVIQNGLNMAGVSPYERMVVFGGLILTAVVLDQLKTRQ